MPRKPKILVEFAGTAFPKRKKFPVDGNKAIIRPAKEGRGGAAQTVEFDNSSLIPYYAGMPPFRTIKHKIIVKDGASKAVSFGQDVDVPSCTKNDVANYGNATVIKLSGALKPPFSMGIIYILLAVLIVLSIIGILIGSGRLHI